MKELRGHIPRIGKRIVKSAIGVWLCYLIHKLRNGSGIIFYSQLAVLWCIQPYVKDSLKNGIQRTVGTLIGAFYGLIVIFISVYCFPAFFRMELCYGTLIAVSVLMVLYTTVVLNKKSASYFSTVVLLSIVVNHIGDSNPFLFVWNRVLDTMIGIVLGVGINMFRIPRKKRKDILFISGIDETLLDEKEMISPYSKIELNRMLDEGANFTVSTMRTPASVIDALDGIHWKLPLIVMDGAALFDMKERIFLKTVKMERKLCGEIRGFLAKWNQNYFMNIVIDGVLVISCPDISTDTEKSIYNTLRKSPYRNFVRKDLSEDGDLLYFMCIGEKAKMDLLYEDLQNQTYYTKLKTLYYPSTYYPGQMYLKIYDQNATKDQMVTYLKELTGAKQTLS
ncbi:MAG: HAD hydrolase family protein, partial [Clostridiales bacterium]|nr:HAD hydrolase family protein [Candidatus Blautia equi]